MEMNMHMPQNVLAEIELRHLAAIPYQIISPSSNAPIIGIYQDSMLGSYRFTRSSIDFTPREAMNMLMSYPNVNVSELRGKKSITNFEILSQITPPISMKYKTKQFDDKTEDAAISNNVLEIHNGKYLRGQADKPVFASGTKGILSRIFNDFGNMAASNYIDDLQQVITEYMKTSAYSVGVSDLISDRKTTESILQIIDGKKSDVQQLMDKVQLGILENNTGKSNMIEFETQVNNVLNKATEQSGSTAVKSLSKNNRFVIMVNSGSKGSLLNISQMISCLGQQNVDGKRIPYGFDNRTLPHFSKYDDSPGARGFIENSYISGLTAPELFFHAMGGRIGLIDTAVKTSQTGYIQRRLVKGLEDLKVEYDMTVRNNMGKIIQFAYGDDSIDATRVENQSIPLVTMSIEDIYMHYDIIGLNDSDGEMIKIFTKGAATRLRKQRDDTRAMCKKYVDYMVEHRDKLVDMVFKYRNDDFLKTPVAFQYLIQNVQGQLGLNANSAVDITPLECFEMAEATFNGLRKLNYCKPTKLMEVLFFFYLSPKELLIKKRFNRSALTLLLENVVLNYKKSIVHPGEMVGVIAGQSIGEPTTQMSLTKNEAIKVMVKIDGDVRIISTTIGEFCDKIIQNNPSFTFNTGHHDSVETILQDEYYIMSVKEDETAEWCKISHVSKHPVNGRLMTVRTRSGRIVETTTSHSHLIRNNNRVEPITGADMRVGMRIPVAKKIPNTFVKETVKIGETEVKLDKTFGWFVGAYLAEGSVNYNTISISNISQTFVNNTKTFAALFGKECKVYEKESEYGHTTDTRFTCAEVADLLTTTCGNGSFIKHIPDFAFIAPLEFKSALLRGYMDGDGNFNTDKNHNEIRACSRSNQLIKDIALLFNYFEIFASLKEHIVHEKKLYNLSISSKYSKIYSDEIGSDLHSEKLASMVKYLNRDVHSLAEDIDKINGLGKIIAKCGKVLQLEGQSRTYGRWKNKDSIGRRTLQKYIGVFEQDANASKIVAELNILRQAAQSNVVWDEIVELDIYEGDQTEYVYDFTVPQHQTFMTDYGVYVHNTLNTFHLAGVSSKSNVTRGVPRIEEILRLTENPKRPSATVYMKPYEQHEKDRAANYCNMIQYTKLVDVVKSVEICFDPNDHATHIHADRELIDQFYEFENMMEECNKTTDALTAGPARSKWVVRIEIDAESLLDKNITMDDIHFAISKSHESDVSCIYSDMNSSNLVFRIRLNASVFKGPKKGAPESLDQSDEIYMLKNFQDSILNNIVLRGVNGITNVNPRLLKDMVVLEDSKYVRKDTWVLDTIGSNLLDLFTLDFIDYTRTYSNDIREVYDVLGIEAARQNVVNEIMEVMEASDAYVNYHHLSILCDRMTVTSRLVPMFRSGILSDDTGPISKGTFEMHTEVFLDASRHGEFDQMRGVSANVMCGQPGYYGTNSFGLVLDMKAVEKMNDADMKRENTNDKIESMFNDMGLMAEKCSMKNIRVDNNVHNLKATDMGSCGDDGYDVF
jgi:DNA-directed RNA polymerase beta' subunit